MNKKINLLKNLSKEKEKDHTIEGKHSKTKNSYFRTYVKLNRKIIKRQKLLPRKIKPNAAIYASKRDT